MKLYIYIYIYIHVLLSHQHTEQIRITLGRCRVIEGRCRVIEVQWQNLACEYVPAAKKARAAAACYNDPGGVVQKLR
jgi:hypothetical protein